MAMYCWLRPGLHVYMPLTGCPKVLKRKTVKQNTWNVQILQLKYVTFTQDNFFFSNCHNNGLSLLYASVSSTVTVYEFYPIKVKTVEIHKQWLLTKPKQKNNSKLEPLLWQFEKKKISWVNVIYFSCNIWTFQVFCLTVFRLSTFGHPVSGMCTW